MMPMTIFPRIHWTRSSKTLALQQLTRDHENLALWLADARTGKAREIVKDHDSAWVDISYDLMFLGNKDRFVWTSEKSGYRHAYLYDYEGNETQLTHGDWEITSLIGVDEKEAGCTSTPREIHLLINSFTVSVLRVVRCRR